MPYPRPKLSDLKSQVAADITSSLPSADGLLRFSNLNVLGVAVAGLAHSHYGFIDWIARQSVPFTSTDEFLAAWGALKSVFQKDAQPAGGPVTFPGTVGVPVPDQTTIVRSDGVEYLSQGLATVGVGGTVTLTLLAKVAGAAGNAATGVSMALGSAIPGIQSTGTVAAPGLTGGTDQEDEEDFRARVIAAFQTLLTGGSASDYVKWATAVAGVTRAWCAPRGFGAGTVVVYVMLDLANAAFGGFPQGTNGVSPQDNRATIGNTAAGDQLTVANAIFPLQPVTPMVYICAPVANAISFTISGIATSSAATRALIAAAIAEVFLEQGTPTPAAGSVVDLSSINSAIAAIAGTAGFVITVPSANIPNVLGKLPVLGTVTYS